MPNNIVSDTFGFFGKNWKALMVYSLLYSSLFDIASVLWEVLVLQRSAAITRGSYWAVVFFHFDYNHALMFLFQGLSGSTIALTTFSFIKCYIENGFLTPKNNAVWAYFKSRFWPITLISLSIKLTLAIAFRLLFIPGCYLWPSLSLVIPIIIFTDRSYKAAFRRSFEIIQGNYLQVLGLLVFFYFFVYGLALAPQIAMQYALTGSIRPSKPLPANYKISLYVISYIIQFVLSSLPAIAIALWYCGYHSISQVNQDIHPDEQG